MIVTTEGRKIASIGLAPPVDTGYMNTGTEHEFLEELGKDGCELVAIISTPSSDRNKLYFKRPAMVVG